MIDVGGRKVWYWDIIDLDTRFLLASRISITRTTKDAALLMKKAADRAGKAPKRVITDKLNVYLGGVELVFGSTATHLQSSPFEVKDSTSVIERFHGTLKDRTHVVRGFKKLETAQLLTDAWLVYYNFMKEHTSLDDVPPAQAMGNRVPFKDWAEMLEQVKQDAAWPKGVATIPLPPLRPIVHAYGKGAPQAQPKPKLKPKPKRTTQKIDVRPSLSRLR